MNLISQYIQWHFFDMAREIKKGWTNYLKFYLNFFSIPLLLKTLFSPWRRYQWPYGHFSISGYIYTFVSNMFSRIIGAFLRLILIVVGLFVEFFIFIFGGLFFLFWLTLPFFLPLLFLFGIKLMFR